MIAYWLILGILSVWRLTHLINAEGGPFDVFLKLRERTINNFFGALLGCFYCLSLWVSMPFGYFMGADWAERVLLWLSFSAGAIILERLTAYKGSNNVTFFEGKEN